MWFVLIFPFHKVHTLTFLSLDIFFPSVDYALKLIPYTGKEGLKWVHIDQHEKLLCSKRISSLDSWNRYEDSAEESWFAKSYQNLQGLLMAVAGML